MKYNIINNEDILGNLCFQQNSLIGLLKMLGTEAKKKGIYLSRYSVEQLKEEVDKHPLDTPIYPLLSDEIVLENIKMYKIAVSRAIFNKAHDQFPKWLKTNKQVAFRIKLSQANKTDKLILPLINEDGKLTDYEFDLSDELDTIKGQILWIVPQSSVYALVTRDEIKHENYPLILKDNT